MRITKRGPLFDADDGAGSGKSGGKGATVTFTQEELDAQFAERAERAGRAAITKLLQSLSVDTAENLKVALEAGRAAAAEKAEAERAKLDEIARARKDAEAATAKAEEAQKALDAERNARLNDRLVGMIEREAAKLGFEDPSDVLAHVDRAKLIGADGAVDAKLVADAVKAVAASKPYLVRKEVGRQTPPAGAKRKNGTGTQAEQPDLGIRVNL